MNNIEAAKIEIEKKIKAHWGKYDSRSPEFELWAEELVALVGKQLYLEVDDDYDDDEDY